MVKRAWFVTRDTTKRRLDLVATLLVGACLLTAIGILTSFRKPWLPPPSGPFAVGTLVRSFVDGSRHEDFASSAEAKRQVVVQLWYPAEPLNGTPALYRRWREADLRHLPEVLLRTNSRWNAAPLRQRGPFPLLLYSSRWGSNRTQNTALAEDLASHGYIVAAVDHPYNPPRVELDDGSILRGGQDVNGPLGEQATAAQRIEFWNRSLVTWVADERFALDQVLAMTAPGGSPMAGLADPAKIGAFGHSFGGAAALGLLGSDPRVRAGLNFDGWSFAGLAHRDATQAVMMVYAEATTGNRRRLAQAAVPAVDPDSQMETEDERLVQDNLQHFGGWRVTVVGAQHGDFSDEPLLPEPHRGHFTGPIAPLEAERVDRVLVRAFFDQALRGVRSPVLTSPEALHRALPEIAAELYSPAAR